MPAIMLVMAGCSPPSQAGCSGLNPIPERRALEIVEQDFQRILVRYEGYTPEQAARFSCSWACRMERPPAWWITRRLLQIPDEFKVRVGSRDRPDVWQGGLTYYVDSCGKIMETMGS